MRLMNPARYPILPAIFAVLALGVFSASARADESPFDVPITIKNHRFEPAEIKVPAARPIRLIVTNADDTPEEIESSALKIERVILPGKTSEFLLRPLAKGRKYKFIGEFNPKTARGQLIVD